MGYSDPLNVLSPLKVTVFGGMLSGVVNFQVTPVTSASTSAPSNRFPPASSNSFRVSYA
jgi:hypothetical protein